MKTIVAIVSFAGCTLACGASEPSPNPPPPAPTGFEVSAPFVPFPSNGDLWLSTWADDDDVFVTWGDGFGPLTSADPSTFPAGSHNGLAKLHGTFPDVSFTVVNRALPFSDDVSDSKTASLLYVDGHLYASIHWPLMHPKLGFFADSDNGGVTFEFPKTGDTWAKPSNFLCRIFLNMGRGYELGPDGWIYVYGIQSEIDSDGSVYLARAPRQNAGLLDPSTWSYFGGLDSNEQPTWEPGESFAQPLSGVTSHMLFSALYHPGLARYVILTGETASGSVFVADAPWGPWTSLGPWFTKGSDWDQSYMPGVITKDLGERSFFFATGGVHVSGDKLDSKYRLRIGSITFVP